MNTITQDLGFQTPAIHIGLAARLSRVLRGFARAVANFNRYMDAAQRVDGASHRL